MYSPVKLAILALFGLSTGALALPIADVAATADVAEAASEADRFPRLDLPSKSLATI
jgi:hypothetical protein